VKICVTGPRGQVGSECVALGAEPVDGDVFEIERIDADAVIHCAAFTNVDGCELDPDRAMRVNGDGTRHVVDSTNAFVVYVSTDYVFDGTKTSPYVEHDATNPINAYGRSKLAGEQAIDVSRNAIVRTSWVYGRNGNNVVKTMLRLLDEGAPMRFVTDQRGYPTEASDLARMLTTIARERRAGIWHVTNQGAVSSYEFARAVVEAAGGDPARVEPITTSELQPARPARRPANSLLDSERLTAEELLPDFRDSLPQLLTNLRRKTT
jgi:dTDP-4-dehydrorhamnose reductase